jgi:hypothetical protein
MDRITDKFLQAVCDRINRACGTPMQPYAKDDTGAYKPQARAYHLSRAYGGVSLHQMCDEGSGVHDVFGCGHVPKRDLSERMFAFLRGIETAKEAQS